MVSRLAPYLFITYYRRGVNRIRRAVGGTPAHHTDGAPCATGLQLSVASNSYTGPERSGPRAARAVEGTNLVTVSWLLVSVDTAGEVAAGDAGSTAPLSGAIVVTLRQRPGARRTSPAVSLLVTRVSVESGIMENEGSRQGLWGWW
jgi:hypothetical protein